MQTQVYHETAIGVQLNSLKRSQSAFSFAKSTRSQRERTHISRQHSASCANPESPGPIYEISCKNSSPVFTLGKADERNPKHSDRCESSVDELVSFLCSQNLKYKRSAGIVFGTDSRETIRNAAILLSHPETLYGCESPGPTCYHLPEKTGKMGRMSTMGAKTKILVTNSQTSEGVGPGTYEVPSTCGASRLLSKIPNTPVYSFARAQQRPELSRGFERSQSSPNIREGFKANSFGKQSDSTKRTAPSPIIGSQSRDKWTKCPVLRSIGDARSFSISHPELPSRIELVKWS